MQPPMPTTTYNKTTEKTKTSNTPATDSTSHKPQQLLQSTNDDKEFIGDDFQTPLPMMTMTKPTTEHTTTTEKPLIGDPFTPQKPQLLTQLTAAISDDAEDDIMMTLWTTMLPTMILTTLNTAMTQKTVLDNAPDIQYTLNRQQPLTQFTGNIVNDAKDVQPMTPMTIPMTANDERTLKTKLYPPQPIHCHQLHPQQPTTNATAQC